jgi:hypothetical protein
MKLSIILLAVLIILVVVCIVKNGAIERFIVTVDETLLGHECPDYVVSDGYMFYLVWNRKVFDGVTNPLTFADKAGVAAELNRRGCPNMMDNIVYLRRSTNHMDPTVSYERECNKQTANPLNAVTKCTMDKIFSIPGQTSLLTAEELAKLRPEEIQALEISRIGARNDISEEEKASQIEKLKKGMGGEVSEAYEYIKRVNSAIASMDTPDLVNYDTETCMFDKLARDDPGMGSPEGLQKFRKYYNQKLAATVSQRPDQDRADLVLGKDSLREFDEYFNQANDLSITNEMVAQIFGDTTD